MSGALVLVLLCLAGINSQSTTALVGGSVNTTITTTTTAAAAATENANDTTTTTTASNLTTATTPYFPTAAPVMCPSNSSWRQVSASKCFLLDALDGASFVQCHEHCASLNSTMLCPESRADLNALDASKTTWLGFYQRLDAARNATRLRPREGWIPLREGCKPFLAWDPVASGNETLAPLENPNDFAGVDENVAVYGLSGQRVVHDTTGDGQFFNEKDRTTVSVKCSCQLGGRSVPLSQLDKNRLQAFLYASGAAAAPLASLSVVGVLFFVNLKW